MHVDRDDRLKLCGWLIAQYPSALVWHSTYHPQ